MAEIVKTRVVFNLVVKMRRSGIEIIISRSGDLSIRPKRYRKPTNKDILRINRMMMEGDLKLVGCSFGKTWMAIYLQPQNKPLA